LPPDLLCRLGRRVAGHRRLTAAFTGATLATLIREGGAMNLDALLDRLAEVAPTEQPFISLYVDTRPDNTGRPHWRPTVRKELGERARSFGERTSARAAYDADAARILQWLESEPRPSAHGLAVSACGPGGVL